jgi:uncharacterized membrane protein YcgQ (UPF0703/DUF1980 family)
MSDKIHTKSAPHWDFYATMETTTQQQQAPSARLPFLELEELLIHYTRHNGTCNSKQLISEVALITGRIFNGVLFKASLCHVTTRSYFSKNKSLFRREGQIQHLADKTGRIGLSRLLY